MIKFPKPYSLGYSQVVYKNSEGYKLPLLIVGANTLLRGKLSAAVMKQWDIHLFFFPNSEEIWKVGILGVSRIDNNIFSVSEQNTDINQALEVLFKKCNNINEVNELRKKALLWLTHSVYKCPKISLRDIQCLENYKQVA